MSPRRSGLRVLHEKGEIDRATAQLPTPCVLVFQSVLAQNIRLVCSFEAFGRNCDRFNRALFEVIASGPLLPLRQAIPSYPDKMDAIRGVIHKDLEYSPSGIYSFNSHR